MLIRVLCTCSLNPYAFVPHVFSYCLIFFPPQFHQMNKDKSKSSAKTTANEENKVGELISNISLEEHAELSGDDTGDEGDEDVGLN